MIRSGGPFIGKRACIFLLKWIALRLHRFFHFVLEPNEYCIHQQQHADGLTLIRIDEQFRLCTFLSEHRVGTKSAGPCASSGLSVQDRDYVIYLADGREVTCPTAGNPINGVVRLSLPAGKFAVSLYSPVSGKYSPAIAVDGGHDAVLTFPDLKTTL